MKNLITVLIGLIFCFFVSHSQSSWQIVTPPVSENFMSVSFTDENHGTIVSKEGSIVSTTDGGNTWQVAVMAYTHFESVHFVNEDFGCIVGWNEVPLDSSRIHITTNGGNSWSNMQHQNAQKLYDVFFINDQIGWTVGFNEPSGWILYTDDAGLNWTRQMTTLGVSGELFGVHFRNETHGHICGVNAMFLHTNNGGIIGNGWALNISIPTLGKDLYAVYNFGELQGCAVGADGIVIYTVDNWANWIQMNPDITDTLWSVTNVEGTQHLWAVGNNGTIIHNQMYILPWEIQESNVTENLNDVCMLSASEGWAVGDNGTILHFTNPVGVNSKKAIGLTIYPNPITDFMVLILAEGSLCKSMELLDVTGKLLEKQNLNGRNKIVLDVSTYDPGIYFLKISNESNHIFEKLIIQ